jgi:protein involved in polysaccharide export with SLBB domain
MGQVHRPGGFEPPPGESMTLFKAIALAGGLTRFAKSGAVTVIYPGPRGVDETKTFDCEQILRGRVADPPVHAGCRIHVP